MTEKHDKALLDLYRKTRQQKPSEGLDERIRQMAQRNLYRGSNRKRWAWGLSTAAVLLLSFNIVLQMNEPAPSYLNDNREQEIETGDHYSILKRAPSGITNQLSQAPSSAPSNKVPDTDEFSVLKDRFFKKENLKIRNALTEESLQGNESQQAHKRKSTTVEGFSPQVEIPELPVHLEALLSFDKGLEGEKTGSGLITIYHKDKLILTLAALEDGYLFKAWSGAEVLGIKLNWNMMPSDAGDCRSEQAYMSCSLNNRVNGLFENDRLDHITWQVKHD